MTKHTPKKTITTRNATTYATPTGLWLLIASDDALYGCITLNGEECDNPALQLDRITQYCGPVDVTFAANALLKRAATQLDEYFSGTRTAFEIRLHPRGTDFQQQVWEQIAAVPYGESITYTELANRCGRPKAFRAAANACGKNPYGIFIPCHRIKRGDGSLGGYTGGLNRKVWLLNHEALRNHEQANATQPTLKAA